MKKVVAVMIFAAVLAVGFFGLMVPRHVLNTFGLATADCDSQNCDGGCNAVGPHCPR
jgi:hypothetical protein